MAQNSNNSYTYIIFDLDDTLCDYQEAKRNAISKVNHILREHGIDVDQFWKTYRVVEPVLWRQFLDKKIIKKEYRVRRYADPLRSLYEFPEELADELNRVYMKNANCAIELFEDVIPLLKILKEKQIIPVIFTSGPSDGQRDKLKALSLEELVEHIYISEEIGVSKPSVDAFEFVLKKLDAHPEEVLMVGDSLEDDIKGAEQAQIRAVLIDRDHKYQEYAGEKIDTLLDLLPLL